MTCCNGNCRQGRDCNCDEGPGLFASRFFWIGAAVSLLLWACLLALGAAIFFRVTA